MEGVSRSARQVQERRLRPRRACAGGGRRAPHRGQQEGQGGEGRGAGCRTAIEKCIIYAATNAAIRDETSRARWAELLGKQDAKLDLLRNTAAAKKRNTDLAFLSTMATMDLGSVDAQMRAWLVSERDKILPQMAPPVVTPPAPPADPPALDVPTSPKSTPSTPDTPSTPVETFGEPLASAVDLDDPFELPTGLLFCSPRTSRRLWHV